MQLGCIVRCRGQVAPCSGGRIDLTSPVHCRNRFPSRAATIFAFMFCAAANCPLLARLAVRRASEHGVVIFVFMSSCLVVTLKILSEQGSQASVTTASTRFCTRASDGARVHRVVDGMRVVNVEVFALARHYDRESQQHYVRELALSQSHVLTCSGGRCWDFAPQ